MTADEPVPDPVPAPATTRSDLTAELAVEPDDAVVTGALFGGRVTITNRHPSEPFDFVTAEWATGHFVRDGVVVNDDLRPYRDLGVSVALAPGERKVLQFRGVTDAWTLAPGTRVPAGDHDLVVVVQASDLGGPRDGQLVSPPVPIRVR